jgi:hypothetical protein
MCENFVYPPYLPPTPSPVILSFPPSSFHLNPYNYAFSTLRISLPLPLPLPLPLFLLFLRHSLLSFLLLFTWTLTTTLFPPNVSLSHSLSRHSFLSSFLLFTWTLTTTLFHSTILPLPFPSCFLSSFLLFTWTLTTTLSPSYLPPTSSSVFPSFPPSFFSPEP